MWFNYILNFLIYVYYMVLNYFYIEYEIINNTKIITLYKNNNKYRFINKNISECKKILNNEYNNLLCLKSKVNMVYLTNDSSIRFDITKLSKQFCYYYDKNNFNPEIIIFLAYKKYNLNNIFSTYKKNNLNNIFNYIVIIFNDDQITIKKEFVKNKNNYFIL